MSRNNPDDELQPLTAFLPGLDLGDGLRVPDKKAGAGKHLKATITPIERRLIEAAADRADQSILYQHTVFCQTGMPHRDPGGRRSSMGPFKRPCSIADHRRVLYESRDIELCRRGLALRS